MQNLPSHPWGPGSRVGYQPYSKMMVGRRPLAGLGAVTDYWEDEMGAGIFGGKAGKWTAGGGGIFAKGYAMPKAIFTEPMYAGANVIDPSPEFREHGLYGLGSYYGYAEKAPGASMRHVAPSGVGEFPAFVRSVPWWVWAAGGLIAWKTMGKKRTRRNPRWRRRRIRRRQSRR